MPPGADMEWGAIVMWAALGFVGCAVALVAALIGFVTQYRTAKSGSDDAGMPNHR
jgi:hypothetical protein